MAIYGVQNNWFNIGVIMQGNQDNIFLDWNGAGGINEIDYNGVQSPVLPMRIAAAGGTTQWPISATITGLLVVTSRNSVGHLISFAEVSIVTLSKIWNNLKSIALTELSIVTNINGVSKVIILVESLTITISQTLVKYMQIAVMEISNITNTLVYVFNVFCNVVINSILETIVAFVSGIFGSSLEKHRKIKLLKLKKLRMARIGIRKEELGGIEKRRQEKWKTRTRSIRMSMRRR